MSPSMFCRSGYARASTAWSFCTGTSSHGTKSSGRGVQGLTRSRRPSASPKAASAAAPSPAGGAGCPCAPPSPAPRPGFRWERKANRETAARAAHRSRRSGALPSTGCACARRKACGPRLCAAARRVSFPGKRFCMEKTPLSQKFCPRQKLCPQYRAAAYPPHCKTISKGYAGCVQIEKAERAGGFSSACSARTCGKALICRSRR